MKHSTEINFSRAVLILLVVLVHIVHFGTTYPAVKEAILAFMMPAFLFITGYLANVDKPAKAFGRYVLQIFLPYFIMVVGFSVLSYFLPVRDKLTELSVNAISERLFVTSIGPYWFLYVMLGCGLLYRLSGLIVRNKERSFCVFLPLVYCFMGFHSSFRSCPCKMSCTIFSEQPCANAIFNIQIS